MHPQTQFAIVLLLPLAVGWIVDAAMYMGAALERLFKVPGEQ